MSSPKQAQLNMVPIIDSDALPDTPAHEWAEGTASALQSKLSSGSSDQRQPSLLTNAGVLPTTDNVGGPHKPTLPPFVSMASSVSTPGNEVPGAYPRDRTSDASGNISSAVETVKGTAYGIYESAKQYFPAQDDVQHALENASTTAKQYLPETVGAYLPGGAQVTTLPSDEVYGNMGKSSGGAGALPGTLSETSVAKLPEERKVEGLNAAKQFGSEYAREQAWSSPKPHTPSTHTPAGPVGGIGKLPGTKSETGVALLPDERNQSLRSTGGVGDLPGKLNETDVLRLPEEKIIDGDLKTLPMNDPQILTTTNKHATSSLPRSPSQSDTHWSTTAQADSDASQITLPPTPSNATVLPPAIPNLDSDIVGGGVLLKKRDDRQGLILPSEAHDVATYEAVKAAGLEPKPSKPTTIGQNDGSISQGELKQRILKKCEDMNLVVMKDTNDDAAVKLATGGSHHHHSQHQTAGHEKERSVSLSSSGVGKPSFMDKVKGEAKIISGKLGKNEEKVEEGKRMMGK